MKRVSITSYHSILTITLCALTVCLYTTGVSADCELPEHFWGDWYGNDRGESTDWLINNKKITVQLIQKVVYEGRCLERRDNNASTDATGAFHSTILFAGDEGADGVSKCYKCMQLYHRTPNVLQYKESSCRSGQVTFEQSCEDITRNSDIRTLFRKTLTVVNCKQTFEGVYHFTYEVRTGGGGICNSPGSHIVACQEPGSMYVDNQVFDMNFGKCPDVSSSATEHIRFQCLGSWRDENNNIYSAVANIGKDIFRERFRCMLTRDDQQYDDNVKRWTLSRWAECSTLKSPYEGDIRLQLIPALLKDPRYFVIGNEMVLPNCNLPRNFTGTWFATGEFDSDVYINTTHVYFKTKIDQYSYKETYFICQMNRDTRYMMTAITVGRCEVDYVCFDFMPRHHNVIRWRMGRPFRLSRDETARPGFLHMKFRETCTWSSFTLDRTKVDWKYNVFLLNPPSPVDCPLAGRYKFEQKGPMEEKYITRIRGITERPRHQIDCRQYTTEFKSCADNPKKIYIDSEYCDTVDHTGRPIGEYDEPDREIACVGFWMEDMRSYLMTYDEEDAISKYRCWVYERLDWRDIIISRSTRAFCGRTQTARSWRAEEGASLSLVLKESERLFDDCPQRYNTGRNPYENAAKVYVFNHSAPVTTHSMVTLFASLGMVVMYYFIVMS